MRNHSFTWLCTVALFLILTTNVKGQSVEGRIEGVVRDPQGAVITGVTVRVSSLTRGVTRTTTTGPEGNFSVPSLLPGDYQVTAEAAGFTRGLVQRVSL